MKNILTRILVLICLFGLVSQAQEIKAEKLSDSVIVLTGGGGNITAVNTDDGIVVIDAFSSPELAKTMREQIEKHFGGKVKHLISTHHHFDHTGGLAAFDDVKIVGHPNNAKRVSEGTETAIKFDIEIDNAGAVFLGGKAFEIFHFGPGHTDNDLVVLCKKEKLLVTGDLVFRKIVPYILNDHGSDVEGWIKTMDELIAISDRYETVVPGHGVQKETVEALKEQKAYLQDLWSAVIEAHKKGLDAAEIKKAVTMEKYKDYIRFNAVGHNVEQCLKILGK